jgi:hypothetical protein
MERWQLIERYVLLATGAVLLAFGVWLAFFGSGIERFAVLVLLVPCIYWVFWQALYEDKLGTEEPPSTGERVMHAVWVWARRIFLGGISAAFALAGVLSLRWGSTLHHYGIAALVFLLSAMAGWVAIFGAGTKKSMLDDRSVHRARTERYK